MASIELADFWRADFIHQLYIFLSLTFRGLGLGLLISLPLGILLTRMPKVAGPIISSLAVLQTIPSLALLGFFISMFKLVGPTAAITAAVVYSLFPIVINTYTGILQVDGRLRDAARGIGMTDLQLLWKVELPLALPVIMAGVRTSAVYAIGVITITAIAGSGGLGEYIVRGMSRGDSPLILLGVIPIMLFTLLLFFGMRQLVSLSRRNSTRGLALGGILVLVMAGYTLSVPIIQYLASSENKVEIPEIVEMKQRSLLSAWNEVPDFWSQTRRFLSLTIQGLGLALLFGLPMGVLLSRFPHFSEPIITALALLQTIPSLALLGFCVSFFAIFGASAAILATVVYSLFPIVLNTYTGIVGINPRLRDAARGMGMTDAQVLWRVELPLALPVIMAGVRTAAIYAIAMVTVGAMVGAKGLGDYLVQGMSRQDDALVMIGVLPILVLSLAIFWGLGAITRISRTRSVLGQIISSVLILLMSTFALVQVFFGSTADIRLGSKNFVENQILGQMLRIMLEKHSGLKVEVYENLGSNYLFLSLLGGKIDMYPEYTGTILTAPDALDLTVPEDHSTITQLVRTQIASRYDLALLKTFGLNNTYAVLVPRQLAEKYGLKVISDLRKPLVRDFQVVVDQEFKDRPDGWKGLVAKYDLKFSNPPHQFDPNLIYRSLRIGKAQVVIGFATDWQIGALDLVILQDDKHYFPSYHAAPLVREEVLRKHPEIREILNRMGGRINDEQIRELSRQVVVEKRQPAVVAEEFLRQQGLLEPISSAVQVRREAILSPPGHGNLHQASLNFQVGKE